MIIWTSHLPSLFFCFLFYTLNLGEKKTKLPYSLNFRGNKMSMRNKRVIIYTIKDVHELLQIFFKEKLYACETKKVKKELASLGIYINIGSNFKEY